MNKTPSVCLAYATAREDDFLQRSWQIMKEEPWVKRIVILFTDRDGKPDSWDYKTRCFYRDFGYGFDKQPQEGGYDELAARNHLLQLAEQTLSDWILVCDADEFFTPYTWPEIIAAHNGFKDVIWLPCYHFCSPTQYLIWPKRQFTVFNSPKPLMDPHARVYRARKRLRYVYNTNNKLRSELKNNTMHCHIQYHRTPQVHLVLSDRVCHVHTRYLFPPKRPNEDWLAQQEKRSTDYQLPPAILAAWQEHSAT